MNFIYNFALKVNFSRQICLFMRKQVPIFSIITVCYNEVHNIKKTIDSIISQTYNSFELIIVDGGSTDGTKDIILQYEQNIAWWCSEKDLGTYNAMNKAVPHASGEYVLFMNAGDWLYNNKVLENVIKSGITTDVIEGYVICPSTKKRVREKYEDLYAHLFADTLSHQGSFIKKELLLAHPYDENYKLVADWKFWIETLILEKHSYAFIETNIAYYDMTGISSSHKAVAEERDKVYNELFAPYIVELIHSYYEVYDLALVKYAVFLSHHFPTGYNIVRKIAKRVVKLSKLKLS